jgi:hypothetical protein
MSGCQGVRVCGLPISELSMCCFSRLESRGALSFASADSQHVAGTVQKVNLMNSLEVGRRPAQAEDQGPGRMLLYLMMDEG